jgi:hypothetical protein
MPVPQWRACCERGSACRYPMPHTSADGTEPAVGDTRGRQPERTRCRRSARRSVGELRSSERLRPHAGSVDLAHLASPDDAHEMRRSTGRRAAVGAGVLDARSVRPERHLGGMSHVDMCARSGTPACCGVHPYRRSGRALRTSTRGSASRAGPRRRCLPPGVWRDPGVVSSLILGHCRAISRLRRSHRLCARRWHGAAARDRRICAGCRCGRCR